MTDESPSARKPIGRPRRPEPDLQRTRTIRFSDKEIAEMEALAQKHGLTGWRAWLRWAYEKLRSG